MASKDHERTFRLILCFVDFRAKTSQAGITREFKVTTKATPRQILPMRKMNTFYIYFTVDSFSTGNAEFGHFLLLFHRGWRGIIIVPRIIQHVQNHCSAH